MIFKHSINSVVRSPGKSFLFLILLTASILFINLGGSMNYSANRMLEQADEDFETAVAFKYGDLHHLDGAWADENFQKNIQGIDITSLSEHPAVLASGQERQISAYAEDGTEIWQAASPVKDVVILTLRVLNPQDDGSWSAISYETFYGRRIRGTVFLTISPFTAEGVNIKDRLQPDKTYLVAANAVQMSRGLVLGITRPASLVKEPDEQLLQLSEITDITDQKDYFESQEGQAWQRLIESLRVIDQSFQVIASSDIPGMLPFHQKQTWLTSGSFGPEEDGTAIPAGSCFISERLAGVLDLQVGDKWHLAYHYDPLGNPRHSYMAETGFVHEEDCTIQGIFHITSELTYAILIPYPEWLEKAPDSYDFLRVRIDNRQAESYLEYINTLLPDLVESQVEDQGYSSAVVPILKLRERSLYLTISSTAAGVAVISLFAYLFIVRQRETADVMMKLGTGRPKTIAYLLFGIMLIAVTAGLVGSYLAGQLDQSLTQQVWASLQDQAMQDLRYSERALGMQTAFSPELVTAVWVRWLTTGSVLLLVLLITLITSYITLQKPKRKKIKAVAAPKQESGSAMSFAWLPGLSLRFALRSIRRNFLRSFIVPAAVTLLAVFILILGISVAEQETAALTIYDRVPVTAYLTTILGQHRQFPIHLQGDVFRILEPGFQSRQLRQMSNFPVSGQEIRDYRLKIEEENPYIEQFLLTRYMHYTYMGVVQQANGQPGQEDLRQRPEVIEHFPFIGYDLYEKTVRQMPIIALTDSVTRTSEAAKIRTSQVAWLEGYQDDDFLEPNFIIVLPDRFLNEQNIALGDTIRVALYEPDEHMGILMEAFDFKVVGSYFQGSRSPVFYAPWSLVTEIKMGSDLDYLDLPDPEKDPLPPEQVAPNEYLANLADSATIIPQDARKLDELRDYLEENGYSQVGVIRSNRLALVIEDKALADGLHSIQQHLSFMNFIIPIMLLLSGIIAFILSYLLTRNRLGEFAIMRSLGSKPIQVYSSFFLEQFFLLLIGLLPIAVLLFFRPEWLPAVQQNLSLFLIVYTTGILIAIGLMGRSKVLDILFTKE